MVRETSIEAFKIILENGLLSEKRQRVYEILYEHGPLIGAQVAELYKRKYGRTSASETIRNRITELRDLGVVKECGKSFDSNTGMKVILWDVTAGLPKKQKEEKHPCPHCDGKGYLKFKMEQKEFDFLHT